MIVLGFKCRSDIIKLNELFSKVCVKYVSSINEEKIHLVLLVTASQMVVVDKNMNKKLNEVRFIIRLLTNKPEYILDNYCSRSEMEVSGWRLFDETKSLEDVENYVESYNAKTNARRN